MARKLASKRLDTRKVVKHAIKRGLERAEVSVTDRKSRREYALGAQLILESLVWQNETRRLIEEWRNFAASEAKDFDEVMDMRMSINGILKIEEVLRSIASEAKRLEPDVTVDDPFSPI